MRLNAKQIQLYTGGQFVVEALDPSAIMTGITWDSREIQEGWLFVALPGERTNGHRYLDDVLRAGALGALVTDVVPEKTRLLAREMGACIIEVPNTQSAITDLARAWRPHLKAKVLGLTGSTGKTTTKNLIRDIVGRTFSVVATKENQNNELGVPRTLLSADPETEVVVVEMGMRGRGQIRDLCDIARPDWGLITNVGESHIELLGSRENIARAKCELFEALPAGRGRAFVNFDDDLAPMFASASWLHGRGVTVVSFGAEALGDGPSRESEAAVWAEDVNLDAQGRPHFTLCAAGFSAETGVKRVRCQVGLRGFHNVFNACAAAAVALSLGIDLDEVACALKGVLPERGRQEVLRSRDGFIVVNDAYNANPDSMRASLSTFCAMKAAGRRIAVLGDMGELGDYACACHEGVGAEAAALPLDLLICVGELARLIADGAEAAGMDPSRIRRVDSVADVLTELDGELVEGDAVLVKASHFMGLTRVVEGLLS